MATANITVDTDSELKEKASEVFEGIGIDMSTAINIFLKQVVNKNAIPFELAGVAEKRKPRPVYGSAKGKIWISDDFDEPLEELRAYML